MQSGCINLILICSMTVTSTGPPASGFRGAGCYKVQQFDFACMHGLLERSVICWRFSRTYGATVQTRGMRADTYPKVLVLLDLLTCHFVLLVREARLVRRTS